MSLSIGVLTVSDTRSPADDTAGKALRKLSAEEGWDVAVYEVRRDDVGEISSALIAMCDARVDVVFTCGGTGLSPRDVTPEATMAVADREVPGIADFLRSESAKVTKRAMLSRARCAQRGSTLIINFPGSEKAARESFGFVADQLEHAVEMMAGGGHG